MLLKTTLNKFNFHKNCWKMKNYFNSKKVFYMYRKNSEVSMEKDAIS